jgi:hypothetical protein
VSISPKVRTWPAAERSSGHCSKTALSRTWSSSVRAAGWRVSQPVTCRTVGGGGTAGSGRATHPRPDLRSTNSIESMIAICHDHAANVKRWQDGQMVLGWMAAGMGEAAKQFRRVNGYRHLPALRSALEATITVTPAEEDAA